MFKKLQLKLLLLLCAFVQGGANYVWGEDVITYTFSSKSWAASPANWTSGKAGNQLTSGRGVQVTEGASGANATSPSFSNISQIVVTYSTNTSAGAGSISFQVGSNTAKSQNVTKTGGTSDRTLTYNFFPLETGNVKITVNCTTNSIFVKKVSITYNSVPYTVTATSNNDAYGMVSVSGNVITAIPADGYRVSKSTPYDVTSGTATVAQSGNVFTVTATEDCTIGVNFEAIPVYTLSSVVSPAAAGTVILGSSSVREDATTTATAVANAGYKFTGWSISGLEASLSSTSANPTTVTMGTADATITATFEAVTTHAISYSVNGEIVETKNIEENAAVDFSAPASGIPAGYVFKGWVVEANKIDTPTSEDPSANFVTSATSTADITYYAVMALKGYSDITWTLDYNEETSLSSSTSWGSYGKSYSYTAGDGGTWTVKANKSSGMQINTGQNCSIKVPSCSGKILSIAITGSTSRAIGFSSSDYSGSGTISYLASGTDATTQTLDLSGKNVTTGYIVPKSGSISITKIVVTGRRISYSNYCTTVPSATISLNAACTDGEGNFYGTYCNSSAFIVPADLTVSCVGVTDGNLALERFSTGDVVKAHTGVLVSSTTSGDHLVTLSSATGTEKDGNLLKAASFDILATEMSAATPSCLYYRLTMHNGKTIGFWWGAEDGAAFNIAANKAYLAVPIAGARNGLWFDDDQTTGVNSLISTLNPADASTRSLSKDRGVVYDLQGRFVAKPTKGLYIVDGRKMVIK